MDFFTATSDRSAAAFDGHITTPGHGPPTVARDPAGATEPVDAFAEAINARYSRTNTLLIPLSPNSSTLSAASTTATAATIPFALAMPQLPKPPFSLSLPSACVPTSISSSASSSTSASTSSSTSTSSSASTSPPASTQAQAQTPTSASTFTPVLPKDLSPLLSDPDTLVLDIRPHNAYTLARLPSALSLSVPSTLLKRPLFSLSKLAQMLSSPAARTRFTAYASHSRILVYDNDSTVLPEGGNLLGLMRKFRKEGYGGEVCWLKGGFHAVWREKLELVDRQPPAEEDEDDEGVPAAGPAGVPATGTGGGTQGAATGSSGGAAVLRTKHLPLSAFTSTSTTSRGFRLPQKPASMSMVMPMTLSMPTPIRSGMPLMAVPPTPMTACADPFASLPSGSSSAVMRPLQAKAHSYAASDSTTLPTPGPALSHYRSLPLLQPAGGMNIPFNPFFDNVRQNLELAAGEGECIVLRLPKRVRRRVGELPFEWLREIARGCARVEEEEDEEDSQSDMEEDSGSGSVSRERSRSGSRSREDEARVEASQPDDSASKRPTSKPGTRDDPNSVVGEPSISTSTAKEKRGDALAKALALQFYKIEVGEQRRLMGVMEHHSRESGDVVSVPMSVGGSVPTPGTCGSVRARGFTPAMGLSATYAGSASHAAPVYPSASASVKGDRVSVAPAMATSKSETSVEEKTFPFSITAGVEKGEKNRYRNIWPFEHTRVRLRKRRPDDDDYMNASYVQPLGTTKRYIATQGPLPATFTDFWTLCWEQNVHVIVMLTREVESALVKCGNYWAEGSYGPLRLRLLSTSDTPERERKRKEKEMASGFFGATAVAARKDKAKSKLNPNASTDASASTADATGTSKAPHHDKGGEGTETETDGEPDDQTIRRTFELTHTGYPRAPPRVVTQLQYLAWPDLDVPRDPSGLLRLMREVGEVVESSRAADSRPWGEGPLGRRGRQGKDDSEEKPKNTGGETHKEKERKREASENDHAHGETTVETSEGVQQDEVDADTGVAKHAQGNAPVLLHCSAGVGRTGGFIAVDAVLDGVRREMRKRREAREARRAAGAPVSSAADVAGEGGGERGEEAGDVDGDGESESVRESGSGSMSVSMSAAMSVSNGSGRQSPSARTGTGSAMDVDSRSVSSSPPPGPSREDSNSQDSGAEKGGMEVDGMSANVSQSGASSPGRPASAAISSPASMPEEKPEKPNGKQDGVHVKAKPPHMKMKLPVTLTAPVSVGGREVHVPVVGFTTSAMMRESSAATLMDIDTDSSGAEADRSRSVSTQPDLDARNAKSQSRPSKLAHATAGPTTAAAITTPTGTKTALKPSPELVSEVRRAQREREMKPPGTLEIHAPSPYSLVLPRPEVDVAAGLTSSSSASERRSTSASGFSTSRSGSSPVSVSHAGSTTSLAMAVRRAGLGEDAEGEGEAVSGSSASSGDEKGSGKGEAGGTLNDSSHSTLKTDPHAHAHAHAHAHPHAWGAEEARLDTWRESIQRTADAPPAPEPIPEPDPEPVVGAHHSAGPTYQWAPPRRLHDNASPPLLSAYEEPIRRVVEDMREQRMSLCQSLRQYVFVYRAIIEGALVIVDAEKARGRGREETAQGLVQSDKPAKTPDAAAATAEQPIKDDPLPATKDGSKEKGVVPAPISVPANKPFIFRAADDIQVKSPPALGPAFVLKERGKDKEREVATTPRKTAVAEMAMLDGILSASPTRAKRQASPTELVHESPSGDLRLSKRPSVKRRQRSSDEDEDKDKRHGSASASTRRDFESMVLGSPPSASSSSTAAQAAGHDGARAPGGSGSGSR